MSVASPPRSQELRDAVLVASEKLAELRSTHPDRRGDNWENETRAAASEVTDLDRQFTAAQHIEDYDLRAAAFAAAVANPGSASTGPTAAGDSATERALSAGQRVTDRDEYREFAERGGRFPEIELRTLVTSYSTDVNDSDVWLPVGTPYLKDPRQQRFFLRDVLDVAQTTLSVVPYIREVNPTTTELGASAVAQASAKPEVENTFVQDNAIIQKIAAWIPVTDEVLQDAPLLASYINGRLTYMVAVREQQQVLNGSGTAPQIRGVLNFSGIQTQAAINDDPYAGIGLAAGKIENVDGFADGVAMNPTTYWLGVVERYSTQFAGDAVGNAPFGTPTPTIWGLPVIRTRGLAANTNVVGNWRMGATLFDRMSVTIRQSDSHSDYFIKNQVAILAEERIGLAVHRPDFFVNTTTNFT